MEIVHTTWVEAPIGAIRIASTRQGLAYVELPHASGRGLDGWLQRRAPDAHCEEGYAPNRAAATQILEYLDGKRTEFDLPLDLRGTAFQRRVWEKLLEIPYGETRSYQDIARAVRRPRALRAVGNANGANPVALVVPCHRVVASGLPLKARLLAMERAHHTAQGCLL
jgi:methylated-DNA-[protein]-cysteine S-methyltransferase